MLWIKLKELLLENKGILRVNYMLILQLSEAKIKYNKLKVCRLDVIKEEDEEKEHKDKRGI